MVRPEMGGGVGPQLRIQILAWYSMETCAPVTFFLVSTYVSFPGVWRACFYFPVRNSNVRKLCFETLTVATPATKLRK